MSKTMLPPAEVYAPHPPDYQPHAYPHGHPPSQHQHPGHHQHPVHHTTYAPVTHQPMSQATNVHVNMAGISSAASPTVGRPWTTNLCACMQDIETCMLAWCCTACFLGKLAKEMDECVCTPCCVPFSLMAMRVKVRSANRIRGSICEDYVLTSCCPLLTMCQIKREMDNVALKKPGTQL